MKWKKKTFITKRKIKWKLIDTVILGSIIIIKAIDLFSNAEEEIMKISSYCDDLVSWVIWILFIIFSVLFSALPYIAIYFGFRYAIKRKMKENTTFDVVTDLEYYRDKFNGVSPATMSLLMDLELENKKDLGAMKLYYEINKVILYDENGQAYINDSGEFKINESDKILLDYFVNNKRDSYMLKEWKEWVICENINNRLIKRKSAEEKKKNGCSLFLFIHFLTSFIIGYVLYEFSIGKYDEFLMALESIPEDNLSFFNLLANNSDYIILTVMLLLFGISFIINFWNFVAAIIFWFTNNHANMKDLIKRTHEGNILTEKLYGMKRFIHDFSSLDEATKEHLILWKEFLVYAVVLEENDIILTEISDMYHINLLDYKNYRD